MNRFDAIVIGSGFGGSVAADNLVKGGLKVAVLERGPWRDTIPTRSAQVINRSPLPHGKDFFRYFLRSSNLPFGRKSRTFSKFGLYDLYINRSLTMVCSSSVGGGSHVYGAVHSKPVDPDYWDNVSACTSTELMNIQYQKFLDKMGSRSPVPDDEVPNFRHEMADDDPLKGIADYVSPPAMGILFPGEPSKPCERTTKEGIVRLESNYSDDSFLGSFTGSKTTLDFIYLIPLLKQGLKLFDSTEVLTIIDLGSSSTKRYRVDCIDRQNDRKTSFFSDNIFVGAGTLNTLKLLFRSSSSQGNGIKKMPMLGAGISGNGDTLAVWHSANYSTDLTRGLPSHGAFKVRGSEKDSLFMLAGLSVTTRLPLPSFIKRRLARYYLIAGFSKDEANGLFSFDSESMSVDYRADLNPILGVMKSCLVKIGELSGRKVHALRHPLTVHQMGGARISDNPEEGVINGYGEVHNQPGLYVVDGAAFPQSLGSPPSMSIAAWSGHVTTAFLNKSGRISARAQGD